MADFAASDVAVTIEKQTILRGSPGGQRRNIVKIVFGDGALTYNTGGVPMPAAAKFGMLKHVDFIQIFQNSITTVAYIWTWDKTNNKLLGIEEVAAASSTALTEIADATAIAAQTLYAEVVGW